MSVPSLKPSDHISSVSLPRAETILESISDGFFSLDYKWRFLYVNHAAEQIFRQSRHDLIGKCIWEVYADAVGSDFYRECQRARREQIAVRFEASYGPLRHAVEIHACPDGDTFSVWVHDIAERKQADEAIARLNQDLQRRAAELQTIFDTAPIGLAIAEDPQGRHIRGNPANEHMLGLEAGEELSLSAPRPARYRVLKNGRELPVSDLPMQRAARGVSVSGEVLDVVRPDGQTVTMYSSAAPLFDEQGRPRGAVGAFLDITQLKYAEQELRVSEERFRAFMDNSPAFGWIKDEHGRHVYLSKAYEKRFGVTLEDWRGKTDFDIWPADLAQRFRESDMAALTTGKPAEVIEQTVTPDGKRAVWWKFKFPIQHPSGVQYVGGIGLDITERERAEIELRRTKDLLETFIQHAPAGLAMLDRNLCYVRASDQWLNICGLKDQSVIGKSHYELFPDLPEHWNQALRRGLAGESLQSEEDWVALDGKLRSLRWEIHPWGDSGNETGGVLIFLEDITEHKRADEALRQSEARLRLALDAANAGTWEWDLQSGKDTWSDELWTLYGLEPNSCEPSYENWLKVVYARDREMAQQAMQTAAREGVELSLEYRVVHPRGDIRWLMSRGRPVCDNSGRPIRFVGIVIDVTERKHAESALIRSEKLASVGRMAASIAHEINNPLAAVMNTLYLARMDTALPVSVQQYLDVADEELKRMSLITRQALGFYRESSAPATVSVSAIMDSAVDLLQSRIKAKRATIRKQYDGDLRVLAVSGELRQVFSNLLLNSLDAIGENGTIRLRAGSSQCLKSGQRRVRVTIADDGSGIETAALPRVFEPFFTTKESLGTGLGLWVSKQIVDKHGGSIRVHSCTRGPRRGTAFSVTLPATHS